MGNVQEKFNHLGDQIKCAAGDCHKSFKEVVTRPKQPLEMPTFGDGRSQDELRTTAEMMYNMDTKQHINIGFLGMSNPSKLALINSCRYINDCIPGGGILAPKDLAVQYPHCDPAYQHLRFWDLADIPGSYEGRCLYAFDALVLVIGEVIEQGDVALIKQANIVSTAGPILITRTDMDMFQEREFGMHPHSGDVSKGQKKHGDLIKEGIKHQLLAGGVEDDIQHKSIYMISSPGMLAVRGVNENGERYVWDEFDFMKRLLAVVVKRRY